MPNSDQYEGGTAREQLGDAVAHNVESWKTPQARTCDDPT